jgi:hypothetical protein
MTPTTTTILLYLVALFLTVATLWPLSYLTQTISPKQPDPQIFWLFIVVVIPFVMLIYFGLAILISDTISVGAAWLTADDDELTFSESLVLAVSYVSISGWLWLRWRNPIAPSTKILGPAIIATVIMLLVVGVIWGADYDQNIGSALSQILAPQRLYKIF